MHYSIRPRLMSGIFSVLYFTWLSFFVFGRLMGTFGIAKPIKTIKLLTDLTQFAAALFKVVSRVVSKFQTSARITHIPDS